ncbi:hypothetical protein [Streptomyces sp. PT12]|uniref:hypothetical protein n=1 Tax=Streptomyces sp. PT12 TaxID=1510197 RepID=UPI000DE3F32A|nr:hypothetical protein [Streptomyces sp. PT12]RBM07263.1 hypothetical protein DEH69_24695 [Streptomyces sp. PT12]
MPEPGSKKYDIHRAHGRKAAENQGVPDRHANAEAKESMEEDPTWRPSGPRTERGRGPLSERAEREAFRDLRPETD